MMPAMSMMPFGLVGSVHATPVPLRAVQVDARIVGGHARLTVIQRYENTEATPIEVVYTFPLDADAAVCGFAAEIAGRQVTADIEEREAAFNRYDEAIAAGNAAVLLDQERPDVFTASLGNLPAGASATISITLLQPLIREGDGWRFALPTTIAPRYTQFPSTEPGQPASDLLNPPRAASVPYGLSLDLRVEGPVRRIDCPSHPIAIEHADDHTRITLSQASVAMDRDLALLITPRGPGLAAAWTEAFEGEHWLSLCVPTPAVAPDPTPREVVFLLDCSGSMDGPSITEARTALALCIRALRPGDRFDILCFGSTWRAFFGAPLVYDAATAEAALTWIPTIRADLGGTEIHAALNAALTQGRSGVRRDVLVLTDGQVSDEAEVIALAESHRAHARVSTFGIGHAASATLVRGLARATDGFTSTILPGERIEAKVLTTFGQLRAQPLALSTSIAGDVAAPLPTHAVSGALVRASWRLRAPAPAAVTVQFGDEAVVVPVHASPDAQVVPWLWARDRIRALEDGAHRRGSAQARGRQRQPAQALIDVSRRFHLICSATSFVGVAHEVSTTGEATLRRVPLAMPPGWGGTSASTTFAAPLPKRARPPTGAPPMCASPAARYEASPPPAPAPAPGGVLPRLLSRAMHALGAGEPPPGPPPAATSRAGAPPDSLYALLETQSFDGLFPWSEPLARRLGADAGRWRAQAASDPWLSTRLVLRVLERDEDSRRDEWRAAAEKAEWALAGHEPDAATRAALATLG